MLKFYFTAFSKLGVKLPKIKKTINGKKKQ